MLVAAMVTLAFVKIGLAPVLIVGGSSVVGIFLWRWTYEFGPVPASVLLPPFLLTVAGLEIHMIEEYFTHFGPAMSRLFDITWTDSSFIIIFVFAGPIVYALTALGIFFEKTFAGFVAWFILIGPGCAELSHFIFPFLKPAIEPGNQNTLAHSFQNGVVIEALPNFYFGVTGRYYFPGLYTAVIPMIPGIYGIFKVVRWRRSYRAKRIN